MVLLRYRKQLAIDRFTKIPYYKNLIKGCNVAIIMFIIGRRRNLQPCKVYISDTIRSTATKFGTQAKLTSYIIIIYQPT